MRNNTGEPYGYVPHIRNHRRRSRLPRYAFFLTLGLGALAFLSAGKRPAPSPLLEDRAAAPTATAVALAAAPAGRDGSLLDPRYSLGMPPRPLAQTTPLASGLRSATPTGAAKPPPVEAPAAAQQQAAIAAPPADIAARIALAPPLPVPRPAELQAPKAVVEAPKAVEAPKTAEAPRPNAPKLRRPKLAGAPIAPQDNRSFFEKLFGVQPSQPGTALAYAAPQDEVIDNGRGWRLSPVPQSDVVASAGTAVYDISARTVYMPNGERLEAHSGLGDKMDDPRFVHIRMHGATPPHVYNLTEREALFHGHRALRLNPVGGSGAIHGRAGLLTHPYLLGGSGASNGCVSFKDYERFLQAFLRGEVKRLVVVAGRG